jgi:hypothetical protein
VADVAVRFVLGGLTAEAPSAGRDEP